MFGPATVVHTLAGDRFALDLIGEPDPVPVFTWDGAKITVGHVRVRPGKFRIPLKLTLDDDTETLLDPGHLIYKRSGKPIRACDLCPSASLLPLYTKVNERGYRYYKEPGEWYMLAEAATDSRPWRKVARMVAEWKLQRRLQPNERVRNKDGNKMNSRPENVIVERRDKKPTSGHLAPYVRAVREAQGVADHLNHKLDSMTIDVSRDLLSILGVDCANLAVGGIFVCINPE